MSFPLIERSVELLDLEISRSGDGRTVTAYAATFEHSYPVIDDHGDYDEIINRAAFNRELGRGFAHVGVLYNHGLTAWGTPSDTGSRPVGTPLDIHPDGRGLITVTRYLETPAGDEMLEAIRSGALKFMSFRGPIYDTIRRSAGRGRMVLERTALGLKEYGPTLFPANDAAAILAVRNQSLAERIEKLPAEAREALGHLFLPTPQDTPQPGAQEPHNAATPPAAGTDPGQEATPVDDPSTETAERTLAAKRRRDLL